MQHGHQISDMDSEVLPNTTLGSRLGSINLSCSVTIINVPLLISEGTYWYIPACHTCGVCPTTSLDAPIFASACCSPRHAE